MGSEILTTIIFIPGDGIIPAEAESTSRSPSPSTSAITTDRTSLTEVVMVWMVKFSLPSFSYQAIVLLAAEAESTSKSPSPSISALATESAVEVVVILWGSKPRCGPGTTSTGLLLSAKAVAPLKPAAADR